MPVSDDAAGDNVPVFSVSEISHAVKVTMEGTFARVRVRGEVSGFKRAASGHLYMTLKDEAAVLDGVCWRATAGRLKLDVDDGMEVIATGRLTTYAGRSKYQIVIESLELAGEGALLKLLEDRRRKLAAEGLFDDERKRALPYLPDVIGVVTSPTGAVIRDILHRLADRFPRRVLVWPVLVQGDGAADQIARAISGFDSLAPGGPVPRPDLLIVARGGGSLEDLWAFNEEVVVRAAAASGIPLIAAVGHETDWTLIDFAADRRAPTPTAAAEMAVPVRGELLALMLENDRRMVAAMSRRVVGHRTELEGLARGLPNLRRFVEDSAQRLDDWSERLANSLKVGLDRRRQRLPRRVPSPAAVVARASARLTSETRAFVSTARASLKQRQTALGHASAMLESLSYQRVLERGFTLIRDAGGAPVSRAAEVTMDTDISIRFADGDVAAHVTGSRTTHKPVAKKTVKKPAKKPAKKNTPDDRQGSLL